MHNARNVILKNSRIDVQTMIRHMHTCLLIGRMRVFEHTCSLVFWSVHASTSEDCAGIWGTLIIWRTIRATYTTKTFAYCQHFLHPTYTKRESGMWLLICTSGKLRFPYTRLIASNNSHNLMSDTKPVNKKTGCVHFMFIASGTDRHRSGQHKRSHLHSRGCSHYLPRPSGQPVVRVMFKKWKITNMSNTSVFIESIWKHPCIRRS